MMIGSTVTRTASSVNVFLNTPKTILNIPRLHDDSPGASRYTRQGSRFIAEAAETVHSSGGPCRATSTEHWAYRTTLAATDPRT
jgi:hypothetical protein